MSRHASSRLGAVYALLLLICGLAFLFISTYYIYIEKYIQFLATFAIGLILLSTSIALYREMQKT
ncbi:MAG: hypothetical protein QW348_06550 [Ignisphaera sp.]